MTSTRTNPTLAISPHQIAVFTHAQVRNTPVAYAGCSAHCYLDYRNFRDAGVEAEAFVIKSDDESYARRILRQLRRDPDHATALVFVDGKAAPEDMALADGAMPTTVSTFIERVQDAQSRARTIGPHNDDRGPDALLVEYMWLRPGFVLEPLADWHSPRRYRYPILEALDRSDSDPITWLGKLERDGMLEHVELRDRQRECDFCGSAHLSFIDVCPSCRSIDVDQHSALHCFTCGYIAPELEFTRGDQRQCPKCNNRLRHIGSDYDRPLETSACGSCRHVFVEGEVVARCSVCQHTMAPTSLHLSRIYSWRLTAAGRLAAQGRRGVAAGKAESSGTVSLPHFSGSLDWMIRMARNNRALHFGLVGLRLNNLGELQNKMGLSRSAALLDEFAARLRELIDDQDMLTRADDETIYLLLPGRERRQLESLFSEFKQLAKRSRQDDGVAPDWDWSAMAAGGGQLPEDGAQALLRRLRGGAVEAKVA